MNQRVGSPETRPQEGGAQNNPATGVVLERARPRVGPTLPAPSVMKTIGAPSVVPPQSTTPGAANNTIRAGALQRVDAMRAQAFGNAGVSRRFDETQGTAYFSALK